MKEEWIDIKGYEGKYRISNMGRIWSIHKNDVMDRNPSCTGYISVGLWKNNKQTVYRVHRLVAEHFINNPNNLPMVDHIDGVRHNNIISNLRWVNQEENQKNQYRGGDYSGGEYMTFTDNELANEIWVDATKKIAELKNKDYFMVSSLGRIRYKKRNNRWGTYSIQTVSPRINKTRYASTTVRIGNDKYSLTYHKMVCLCFLRPLKKGEVVNHINSNISDCRLSNLEIITQSENNKKAIRANDKGVNNGRSNSTKKDILSVLDLFFNKHMLKSHIAKKMNMAKTTVTRIVTGETYKEIFKEFKVNQTKKLLNL